MHEQSIFIEALGKEDPAERAAFLAHVCAADPVLRLRIERLLQRHQQGGSFLESPAPAPDVARDGPLAAEAPGTVIGPYKLLEPIGEGGMGSVYMAEQIQPVRRRVALKVIKPGMDTKQVIARFEAERQALALMDHPSIARVLDAGATESGRPYFAMELVKGIPITAYCDQARLSIAERLALFVQVCQAVQHAHQKGIIHRDLKPTNILVTIIDGAAMPKVIDFGVAKATGQPLTEKTLFTAFAQMVGTPLYMSPEQVALSGLDIDTRSDIYSLGVLLYELLTGTTPFDTATFRTAAFDEVRRMIREEEPPTPSTRLSDLGDTLTTVSANRQSDPRKLNHALRGELDWIVLKALEKDRRRRYETAGAFAADVQRHLADQPVEAGPPSHWYRFAKFARRNRAAMTTGLVVASALMVGTVVSTWQAIRATRAERSAEDQRDLAMQKGTLAAAKTREATEKAQSLEWQLYINQVNRAQSEWAVNNVAEAEQLLDACPPALRGWEWRHIKRLCHLELLTYIGQTQGGLMSVAFSPDGTRVVSGTGAQYADGELTVWDAATGREAFVRRGLKGLHCAVFSPDGRAIASGDTRGGVTLWDAHTGREIFTRPGNGPSALGVAFSPDGRHLVAGFGVKLNREIQGSCKLWDAATGTELWSSPGPTGLHGLAVSPDGTRLALAGGQVMELWDLGTRQRVRTFHGHTDIVFGVAFSPDGTRLASASRDSTVRLWDAASGTELRALKSHTAAVTSVAFSPDGRNLVSSGGDRTIKLWDAADGAELATFRCVTNSVFGVAFSPDGTRLASAHGPDGAKVWDVRAGYPVRFRIGTDVRNLGISGGNGAVSGVAFSPDGKHLAISGTNQLGVSLWDIATGTQVLAIPARAGNWTKGCLAFSPDGTRLATALHQSDVKLWDTATGHEALALRGHVGAVHGVAFSPDGRQLASAGDDGTVRLWDAATGKEERTLTGHFFAVIGIAFSPDGRRLASASAWGEVSVCDPISGREVFSRRGTEAINEVALSPDGRRVAWATGQYTYTPGEVKVCDVSSGREILTLRGHTAPVRAVRFSPDGTRLASSSHDRTIKLWDAATGAEVLTLRGDPTQAVCLAFSGDGHLLASGTSTARLWDATPVPAERQGASARAVASPAGTGANLKDYRNALLERYGQLARNLLRSHDRRPGDAARAVALARKAFETDPDNTAAINLLAWLLATCPDANLRDAPRAVALARKAVEKDPHNASCWNTLGTAHYRAGDWQAAIKALNKSEELSHGNLSPFNAFFLAMAHRQRGENEPAHRWYDKAIEALRLNAEENDELVRFRAETAALLGLPDPAQEPAREPPAPTSKPG